MSIEKRIYLDNCCFNRPYDDQGALRVFLESQAKMYLQEMIRRGELELATSYVLLYENARNPFTNKRTAIEDFLKAYSSIYIGPERAEKIQQIAVPIMAAGIKPMDAYHVACAIEAECGYFLSTDQRLIKYRSNEIALLNPLDFLRLEEK